MRYFIFSHCIYHVYISKHLLVRAGFSCKTHLKRGVNITKRKSDPLLGHFFEEGKIGSESLPRILGSTAGFDSFNKIMTYRKDAIATMIFF